jgi:hypothetical protein
MHLHLHSASRRHTERDHYKLQQLTKQDIYWVDSNKITRTEWPESKSTSVLTSTVHIL